MVLNLASVTSRKN